MTGLFSLPNPLSVVEKVGKFLAKREINKVEDELRDLRYQMSEFERRFGAGDEPIDARRLMVSPAEISALPTTSEYIDNDGFYALLPKPESGWSYEYTTEAALVEELIGEEVELSETQAELFEEARLNLWKRDRSFQTNHPGLETLRSTAFVQRLPHHLMLRILELSIRAQGAESGATEEQLNEAVEENMQAIQDHYKGDPTGMYLTSQLQREQEMATQDPNISVLVDSLHKEGSDVSGQFTIILRNVIVDGIEHKQYFLIRKLIGVTIGDN